MIPKIQATGYHFLTRHYRALDGTVKLNIVNLLMWTSTGLGVVLTLVFPLFLVIVFGLQGFGRKLAAVAALGLLLLTVAYELNRYLSNHLSLRDIPPLLVMTLVLTMMPFAPVIYKRFEHLNRLDRYLDERLIAVEAVVGRAWRPMDDCTSVTSHPPKGLVFEPLISGLLKPVYITHAGDDSGRLFVVEKAGIIRIIKAGTLLATPFLDIREHVISDDATPNASWEQGLLSIAFAPIMQVAGDSL